MELVCVKIYPANCGVGFEGYHYHMDEEEAGARAHNAVANQEQVFIDAQQCQEVSHTMKPLQADWVWRCHMPWQMQANCQYAKGDKCPHSECQADSGNSCKAQNARLHPS